MEDLSSHSLSTGEVILVWVETKRFPTLGEERGFNKHATTLVKGNRSSSDQNIIYITF